jgi:Tfp pilus assembly protein PilW
LLSAFTTFFVTQQRSFQRHRVEIASSQSLRNALEQISRELRSAGFDPTSGAAAGVTLADTAEVDFTLDANMNGVIDGADPSETRKFRRNGTTIESYQSGTLGSWLPLADFAASSGVVFRYFRCDETEITTLPASTADRALLARIDVSLTMTGVGGVGLSRTETESVRLRNQVCP